MTHPEHIQDFNSEFVRFIVSSAKQKSFTKILNSGCKLCLTLPGLEFCGIYQFQNRHQELNLISHSNIKSNNELKADRNLYFPPTLFAALKGGETIIEKNKINIPLFGYRNIFGILYLRISSSISYPLIKASLASVSTSLEKVISDFERIAHLRNKLAERTRIIQKKTSDVEKKTLLAMEANHRVRNNLQIIHSMLINRIDEFKIYGDEAEITIRKIASRIMAMAQVYDQLLISGDKDVIQGDVYLNTLLDDLIYGAQYPKIRVARDIHRVPIKLNNASVIGIILIELVTNAFIHAFPDLKGNITVSLNTEMNGRKARLTVKDDGKGISAKMNHKRNGVKLIERLIDHIGGSLSINTEAGTNFLLLFNP